ncbi:MAG: tRNA (adenosine(37)-N6)-threonylcarbamoyltransferase complex ATPase subunit type 1 TsaE [Verrucomicrobia bacterium]|nr:tRNA (adenosine(37)-N6)-threonylcarbamoyltransferase complex ATPase subunit type 1 TsaE [Cytophagales bacterium]
MSLLTFENATLEDLSKIAPWIIRFAENEKIWLVEGEMGAGKTTLIQAICKSLGIYSIVQSPTFALVNGYENVQGKIIYHFDFYRIKHQTEAFDIGFEEYLTSGNLCLIEWASKIPDLLPENYLKISINLVSQNQRNIFVSHF